VREPHTGGRGAPADVSHHRLSHDPGPHELGDPLFLRAADLAEQRDAIGLGVVLEAAHHVGQRQPDDRVAADVHQRRQTDPGARQVVAGR
jgi:hypothetical protein